MQDDRGTWPQILQDSVCLGLVREGKTVDGIVEPCHLTAPNVYSMVLRVDGEPRRFVVIDDECPTGAPA